MSDDTRDRITYKEFVALTVGMEGFTVELLDAVPYIGGQPVEPAAFRQAMPLLRTRPPGEEPAE